MNPEILRAERNIKKGQPHPIYVLLGEDAWGKDRFRKQAKTHILDEDESAFNLAQMDARESNGISVADAAAVFPLMGKYRLITVSHCCSWVKADWTAIAAYADEPNTSTCLILDWGPQKGQPRLSSKNPNLIVLRFDKPKTWELTNTITNMAAELSLVLNGSAASLIAEYSGDELGKVQQDLEKLKLFKSDGSISEDDVAALMGRTRPVVCWELNRFLGSRDLAGALKKMHAILDSGEPLFGLLGTISRYVKQLFESKNLIIQGIRQPSQIGAAMGLPKIAVQELIQHQKNYSGVELRHALGFIRETDLGMRTLRMDRRLLLDRLVTQIVAPNQWSPPNVAGARPRR